MRRVIMIGLMVLGVVDTSVFSQEKGRVVPVGEFIKAYTDHSYTLRMKYEALRNARAQKLLAESVDDLNLTAETGYSYGKDINSVSGTTANLSTTKIGLSKSFSATGTTLQITDSFGFGKAVGSTGKGNNISIAVIQPVLRNFFGYMSRIPIAQAALAVKAAELDYQESLESTVQEALDLYLRWISYYNEKQMLSQIITNNQVVFNQTRAQLRAGIAEVSDLEIARVSVIQYQQQMLSNKANYTSTIYQLNDYLAVSPNDTPDLRVLSSFLEVPNEQINPNYIRSIRSLNYLLNSGQLAVNYARNMYLPNLDVVASYGQVGGNGAFLGSYNSSQAKTNFYVGVQFSMPLFFMQSRGQEMKVIAEYENILLQRDQAIRDILRSVKDLQSQLSILSERLQQQDTLISALQRQVDSQTRQFRRGTMELENLVNGRNSLSNARLSQNTLQVQTSQLFIQYLAMVDKLQERYKDSIPSELQAIFSF